MKKNYLLIIDIFLIANKIFLSQGLFSYMITGSRISTNGGEYGFIKAIKKPVFSKLILVLLTGLIGLSSYGQTYKPFSIRKKIDIRGKMIVAGNTILGKDNLPFNDNTKSNQDISMQYIDIDGDASTFSSSSADLSVPPQKNGSATTCYRVAYAALYWGAMLQTGSRTDINKVKIKLPGATTYNDITGQIVYDAIASPIIPDLNTPYACYADVTNLLSGLPNLTGTYTVANVISSIGSNGTTGLSAGWTLFVVYEDPTLQMKSFNVFDGFSHIYASHFEKIPVTGFVTPPSGNVDLQFAYAALDGDKPQGATKLEFGTKQVVTPLRPANNFFISTIENTNGVSTPRNPFGSNTLGYDTGALEVIGANPEYITNNQTSTDFTLQVARGQADPVFAFFSAYAVDIIAPKIDLTKIVKNTSGVNVGGGNVTLGQSLTYEISYQSVGNDNVKNFTIKDVLPINIIFNPATDINYTNSGGATFKSYDPLTRTIIFNIPNTSVEVNDGIYTIRLNIKVVPDCNSLATACSNEIKNQAFATYQGVINTNVFQEEGSFASTACKLGSPSSTNFLVDITNCKFTQNVILCGSSVVLKASDGYSTYSWSRNPDGSSPIGTGQRFTATQIGVYYVHNTSASTCKSIVEEITVKNFGVTNTNPVIPYAQLPYLGEVVTCPDDGKKLPNLFLCGINDTRVIRTGISDASSIEWYKLNEGSCTAVVNPDCANESTSCTWSLVGTGPDYTANTSGQFRLTIKYPGGCFSQFYFNVYQNLLNPTVTSKDILCNTNGQITVGGVPSGYEYSLNFAGPYQSSNVFPNASFPVINAGSYTVYIKQVGVTANPCIFSVPNILIRKRDFTVSTFLTQPLCKGDKGAVKLVANDALPQYYFSISQGATLVNSVGPIVANEYQFSNLNPGIYTVRVRTDDGCDYTNTVTVKEPDLLTATAAITKPLTCTDGEITVYPVGGTPPFIYYVNSSTVFQSTPQIVVTNPLPTGGIYNIVVEDSHNCTTTTSITVAATPPPVYTMSKTDIKCYNDNTGVINFNVTNANGYTLAYSIDNGVTYLPTQTFSNLFAGTYNTIVRYTLGTSVCYGTMQPITISQPSTALTASAGVSELAGCGPSGEGKIRITNPQGGTAPYEYSFDNQATWTTVNDAYKAPGTYTVYIRDANKCVFSMPNIIIDPKPVEPTINVDEAVFNCDGTATSTVIVTNNGGANYSYQYLLDGVPNTNVPPNVFTNVPSGTHTVSVSYKLLSVPTYSNLLKEDFGSGAPTTSPGIASAYCFNDQHVSAPYVCGTRSVEDNQYSVTSFFWRSDDSSSTPAWYHYKDHTTNGSNANGRYLLVNIGSAAGNYGVLYSKPIVDVIPNQPVKVDLYVGNLLRNYMTNVDPDFIIELVNPSGVVVASQTTGIIPKNELWNLKSLSLNPGPNTSLTFKIRSGSIAYNGNDAVIDDIRVYQLPKSCITTKDFTISVSNGKAFDASITAFKNVSCSGANDGTITIAAQNFDATKGFQYSINNGTTWNSQLTSPYTITGLANGTYTILIRSDATSTGTCVKTFSQIIKAPTPLTVAASVTSAATCSTGATVTAVGTGGTLAYQYELRNAAGVAVIRPYQLNAQFTNVPPGNYTVFVKDANGCVSAVGAAINVVAPSNLTATLDPSSDICFDSVNQASLVVNVSGGTSPFVYSLDGAPAQNSNTFNDVSVGNHTIIVTDSFGCPAPAINVTIAPQLTTAITNIKTLDCTASPNAVITGTITGGNSPFVVTVLSGTGPGTIAYPTATTFTYTTAVGSTYQFQITDSKGCSTTTTATINPLVPITATTTDINPSCSGADGSVQIIPSGGVGPYTYSKDGTTYVPGSLFSGLGGGTYTFYVKDSNTCFITKTVTLTQPTTLAATVSVTPFTCSATNTKQSATVTVIPTLGTGTAPYQYSFNGSGYNAVNTLTLNDNGLDQPYSYSVRDAKGCVISGSGTLLKLNSPTDLSFTAEPISCLATTTTVTATATNGVGTLTYEIVFPVASAASNTTGVFAGLSPETYIFKVTDANGCYYTESHIVNPVTSIAVIATKLKDVDCFGNTTGAIRYNVSGFTTYSYSVNGGTAITGQTATEFTLPNLAGATYNVVFTDETTGCTAPTSITITQPSAILSANIVSNVSANCKTPYAVVTINATGGTPNYKYAFVPDGVAPTTYVTSNIANLDPTLATDWDVWVMDLKGCTIATPIDVHIAVNPKPTLTASVLNQCTPSGSTFQIKASATLGVAPYTYTINTGVAPSPADTFTVAPGTYTITVTDNNGCTDTETVTVNEVLNATAVLTKDLDCTGSPDATIKVTVIGGKGPFTYKTSIDGAPYTVVVPVIGNSFTYTAPTALVAHTYQFEITDANSCTKVSNVINVNPIVYPVITGVVPTQTIKCNGDNTGIIRVDIDANKGIGPFSYSIDGTNYQSSNLFTGLAAGSYTVTVKNSKGCINVVPAGITITEPTLLTYTYIKNEIICNGSGTTLGSIIATPTGGTAPYTFVITNNVGVTVNPPTVVSGIYTFDIVNFGIYELSFVDANGCSYKEVITMASPPSDLNINVNTGPATCTTSTIDVTVNPDVVGGPYHFALFPIVSGSTPPYEFATNMGSYQNANDSNILNPGYLQSTFTGLNPGVVYSFIVFDEATNCYYFKQAESATLTSSTLTSTVTPHNVKCKGAANGSVDFTFTNTYPVATNVTYEIFNSQTNLTTGITGTETGLTGTVTKPVTGLGLLGTGTYYILFKEVSLGANNGCTNASTTFTISESAVDLSVIATIIKNVNCNDDGIISAQPQGGTAPYTYQYLLTSATLDPTTGWIPDTAFSTSIMGNYIVYVKDAYGCIKPAAGVNLIKDPTPVIGLSIANKCVAEGTFELDVALTTAGIAPYTIVVNGSSPQNAAFPYPTIAGLSSGLQTVTIMDANGCSNTQTITIDTPLVATPAITALPTCANNDGVITMSGTGGTGVYTYTILPMPALPANISGNVISGLPAGTYTVTMTDTATPTACSTTSSVTLSAATPVAFTTTTTPALCFGETTGAGSITVVLDAANNNPNYTYEITAPIIRAAQSSNVFTGLLAGTYSVKVNSGRSCSFTNNLVIVAPATPLVAVASVAKLTCGTGNVPQKAIVTVTGSGGTGAYEYSFDGIHYSSQNTYETYSPGNVIGYVRDANTCVASDSKTVDPLNPPTQMDIVGTPILCAPLANTTSTVTLSNIQNGVAPFTYQNITSGTSNSSGSFSGLTPGTYLFQVTDANLCTYQESYTVNPVTNITVSGQLISDVTCNPGTNGEVLFTVGNFAGTYTYSINGGAASAPQSSLTIPVSGLSSASTQTIVVTDVVTGCTATTSINVAQPAPLTLVANPFINANCNFGAQVSVTASGGVAPYSYSYVISGLPAGTYSTSASAVLDPALATSWDVYVKDANGCVITAPLPITIATDPLPSGITVPGLSQCPSATGTYTFTVNVATGVGPYEFSMGSGFQTSPTFTVNAPGTYTVVVKDKNGCSTTATGLVVIVSALQLQAVITALPSCTDGDGTLTLTATGGSGTYEYSIDSGTYQASANITNIFAGTHSLTVRDVTTNCTKSILVTFGAATPITGFALSKTDVTCNGGNDGTITATMSLPAVGVNDNPIYTYSIDGGATTQTSTIFSGLIAGTYTVTVTSARGCLATATITVNEPAIIAVPAPNMVQFGCNSGSNAMNFATITVTGVTGGSGVYTNYEFLKGGTRVQFGASNVYTEANLLGGTYTVNVYDDKGCVGTTTAPFTIAPYIALDKVNVVVNAAITCANLEDITVSATSIGGTPTNLRYTVADSNATTGVIGANYNFTNTTGVFTGLNIGNYLITVENLDTGCSIQDVHYVSNPNTFDLNITNIVDVTCFGGTNGTANVTIIDRTITATNPDQAGPFSYTIVDALGNPVTSGTSTTAGPYAISALAAGTYSITATLTNSPYCSVTKNFTINQPNAALTIVETHTAITCISGNNDGSISASAVGGWPGGYEFQLELGATVVSPWSTVTNFTGLTQGTYTVGARDARGCSVFVDVLLSNPTPIVFTASPSAASVSCFGGKNASITVSLPTGGQGSNYLYTLNTTSMVPVTASGPQASPIFSGLGAGTYTITVTDGYSCSATSAPIIIGEPSVVTTSLIVATTQTCNNLTTVTLSAVGGTSPYTYSADGIVYNATTFNPSVTFPVAVGTHHYYVKDANGCTSYVSNDIQIDPLPALNINLDLSNAVINCPGDATGVIIATAQGGLGSYVYTLQDASGNPLPAAVQSSPGVFTQLVAGDYKVQVSSLDCSATSALIPVTGPSVPLIATYVTTDATCNGANNGTIVINASGGTGIIKYAISPRLDQFFVSNKFELLQPGFYEIIAQDQNGCYIHTLSIEIKEPALIIPSVDPLTILQEMCFGDKDAAFAVDITGGTLPYSVSLDKVNGPFIPGTATQTMFDFTGLAGGNHTVYIRDANMCNAEIAVPLLTPVKLDPKAIVDYGCLNNSPSLTVTVTIDASITNPADVDYALDGSGSFQASNVFTNLSPGIHHITARHTNGCEKDTPDFEILQIDPLTLVLSDGGLNEIVATTTGGSPGYKYTLNGEDLGSQNTFIYYKSGDYTVTVTDSNGCVATATRHFEFIDIKIPNVFTPNGDGDNDGWTPTNTINYPDLIFHVFDRYGRKVGSYREGQSWDGKYNGKELPTGDYWYVLKLQNENDSREFVGHFTLYR